MPAHDKATLALRAARAVVRLFLILAIAAFTLSSRSSPAFAAGEAAGDEAARAKAGARLDDGIRLFQKGMFDAALAEFLESRRLYPFRSALFNAALCLEKLGRYDEAAEQLEQFLREIDENTPEGASDKERAQRRIIDVNRHIGTIELSGAEPGATLSIDGRQRGEYPLIRAVRVAVGNHTVRVFKPGFEPFEARVAVAGGASVRVMAELVPLARTGRVQIQEKSGQDVIVEVDGNPVGKAPWGGLLAPGAHMVLLRGKGQVGTPPVSFSVEADKALTLSLTAEDLASAVRVEPVPVNAVVAIDKVAVGSGVWEGRLRPGAHLIEIAAPGFLSEIKRVDLARGGRADVRVELSRDPSSPFAPRTSRLFLVSETALLVAPLLAGRVAMSCGAGCSGGAGLGGRALLGLGYESSSGLGGGVTVGWLGAAYRATGRQTTFLPVGQNLPQIVRVDDTVWARGALVGAFASLSYPLPRPLTLNVRIGGGALLGSVSDTRLNTRDAPEATALSIEPTGEKRPLYSAYLSSELSLGFGLGRGFQATLGLNILAAFAPTPPAWSTSHPVFADLPGGRRTLGTFSETFAGPIVALGPALGVRHAW